MTTVKSYISSLNKHKQEQLNLLIAKYETYPVGTGYADIIILRSRCVDFIDSLTNIGIAINSVSWWCNGTDENKNKYGCPHGYGGPMTKFGWFSEMCHDFDDLGESQSELFLDFETAFNTDTIKNINGKAINLIQNKQTITYADGTFLTFKNNPCLTPGLWLYVPDDWTSNAKE